LQKYWLKNSLGEGGQDVEMGRREVDVSRVVERER